LGLGFLVDDVIIGEGLGFFDDIIGCSNEPISWLEIYWQLGLIRVFKALDQLSSLSGSKIMSKKTTFVGIP